VFLPLAHYLSDSSFSSWGWRVPFLLSSFVIAIGYFIRREVEETPAFVAESKDRNVPKAPVIEAFRQSWQDMFRVTCMSLTNVIPVVTSIFGAAYAVQPGYGIRFHADVYLWIPVLGNILAVFIIPFVGRLSDKIGRKPPMIAGMLLSGLLSYAYLYAISIRNVPLAIAFSLLMWGTIYQGYNAVFPSFYPELFRTRFRVTAVAIAQNLGTTTTALLPVLYTTVSPPGSAGIPLKIGSITLGITAVAAVAAWTARETYRIPIEQLGGR